MPSPVPNASLPQHVDAQKFCQQGARAAGTLPVQRLSRLAEIVARPDGAVQAEMQFSLDEQYRRIVRGKLAVSLWLNCQRCLQDMPWSYQGAFELALVTDDEQAARLPRHLEPIMLQDGEADLYALLEDEILLAMPMAPQHEPGDCNAPAIHPGEDIVAPDVFERKNPFQVLASLKTTEKPRDDGDQ